MTNREQAEQNLTDSVREYLEKTHEQNYHTLHVRRDGSVTWFEAPDPNSDLIDRDADEFMAIRSVAQIGCGGCTCNCQYCNDIYNAKDEEYAIEDGRVYNAKNKYQTREEAIDDAIGESDWQEIETTLHKALADIPIGYFYDEEEEREQ